VFLRAKKNQIEVRSAAPR